MIQLTAEQHAIIEAPAGHAVITAVAGSGKTTTLAWRIRHLLEQGQDPRRILILMFNRSARLDFERKLREVCEGLCPSLPEVRTFHAMGYRLYQRFVREGYLPGFKPQILSEQEIQFQIWQLLRHLTPSARQDELQRDKKDHIEIASAFIDLVKSSLQDPEILFEELDYDHRHRYLVDLFDAFEDWRKQEGRISYADMLYEPVQAIGQYPELQRLVADKMDIILVDEYQDTNEVQHRLLGYVAGSRAKVTVVGDPDQTIYEFRGARPEYLLHRFARQFPQPTPQTLSYSFRYGHRVALLANHLIAHNRDRNEVLCRAHPANPATRVELLETRDEPASILRLLEPRQRAGTLDEVAILVRVWSQAVHIELALLAAQVPYRIEQDKGALFTRELITVLDLLMYADGRFPALTETERTLAFQRILRFPHVGLNEHRLHEFAAALGRQPERWGDWLLREDLPGGLAPIQKHKLRQLGRALNRLSQLRDRAHRLLDDYCRQTELFKTLRDLALTHALAEDRIDRVQGLLHYLTALNLSPQEALDHLLALRQRAGQPAVQAGVTLTTIHRAKGLEWPVVILPGLNDRYLPYLLKEDGDRDLQLARERRLLYVALTRARRELYLLSPPRASGGGEPAQSSFLAELRFEASMDLAGQLERGVRPPQAATDIGRRYLQRLNED